MKIIVLFMVPSIGKEISSNLRWFSNNKPLITEMEDEHIKNARCWLHRQIGSLKALGYKEPVNNGFSYSEWLAILGTEEKRREFIVNQRRNEEIEKLRLKTLSVKTRKERAAKLLANNPSDEQIVKAKELLGIAINDKNKPSSDFDHAFDAHESMLSYYDY